MIGVRESSYEVVRGIHLKMAKGRGLAGVDRTREGMEQAARNLSPWKTRESVSLYQHRQYGWPKHNIVISADVKQETEKGHNVFAFVSTTRQSIYYE